MISTVNIEMANKLDNVFDKALVLLGIIAAAEFAYVPSLQIGVTDANMLLLIQKLMDFTFKLTTIPFIVLILVWIVKELVFKNKRYADANTFATLFCWDFWSFSLFAYLVLLFSFMQKSILNIFQSFAVVFLLYLVSITLTIIIAWAYSKGENITKWYKVHVLFASSLSFVSLLIVLLIAFT